MYNNKISSKKTIKTQVIKSPSADKVLDNVK